MYSMAGGVLGGVALATLAAHVPALVPSWCRPPAKAVAPSPIAIAFDDPNAVPGVPPPPPSSSLPVRLAEATKP